ncbi:enoyl-CoA hydratase/isomerase family protein [Nocardia brasiliensis]|uniref:3-hydroxyisobutyryl-CoA hydrolase n=1 Tax=Nocardia brasiliensis (strain ATCC 700358 / HUJEG-1) TaxID=1133849 RepID=K0EQE6_NOCB7|nr:enoyl-CoA hydratase/isomerase family protein [Nocardia brasiliensis]AFT99183.1 3-hydroxyisobutyryl-CoA hydrolase [Nocardia brasiliensis ATCC 700358]OCF85071.1 3-hydroxyisobutyryl-CoA hydrolase [Nocardia brasiliensis]
MTDAAEPEVRIEQQDGLGLITLNRPKAINALNHSMTLAITEALRAWADDDAVRTVVLTGAGERGLCAGGDIVAIHTDATGGAVGADSPTGRFWRDEYLLNALIGRYPKPYVVVMDGIVMGGGVGLSGHGSHRIVTERSKIGMPEVGIGFVPDVGGTYLLARSPGEIGTHVALTTARMDAGDAIAAGFADYFVTTEHLPALLETLRTEAVEVAIAKFATGAPESGLLAQRGWIDACYGADTVEEIVARLQAHEAPEAGKAAADILTKSPVALKVALRSLRSAGAAPSLEVVLNEEYRVSIAALASHDLVEGIRAQVIDKDRAPQWSPATLADVSAAQVDAYFAELGDQELGLVSND